MQHLLLPAVHSGAKNNQPTVPVCARTPEHHMHVSRLWLIPVPACTTQINEADGPMLLAGSADGAVRVWRSYTLPGEAAGPCEACIHLCL